MKGFAVDKPWCPIDKCAVAQNLSVALFAVGALAIGRFEPSRWRLRRRRWRLMGFECVFGSLTVSLVEEWICFVA
jgi:hypothetical protein